LLDILSINQLISNISKFDLKGGDTDTEFLPITDQSLFQRIYQAKRSIPYAYFQL
jgi:hypothetical protein